ncbi:hypothetical protein HYS50_02265 [Candidatus Woesearchaeota archaeon]|nr:hypothetical protein [Candidatus Woesearchaeota archaeon]
MSSSSLCKENILVLILSVLLLSFTLLVRLFDLSQLLFYFPLDYINDITAYMVQLHFLDVCGFERYCPYWYNGFIAFQFTPPGWYFFAYPLLLVFSDVKIATYLAVVLSLVLGFLITWYGGKKLGFKPLQRLFFFLFFAANANAIRGFLRTGRPHELLAWMLFFGLFFMLLWYKDRKITPRFYTIAPLYAACIITYVAVGVFASLLLIGLFLIKHGKERWHVAITTLLGVVLTFFWTIPYVLHLKESSLLATQQAAWLLQFTPDLLLKQFASFVFPLFFLFLFYLSWKYIPDRRHLLFFLPTLIITVLYIFRLNILLPVFRDIFPSPYFNFFLLLSGYLYITISPDKTFLQRLTHSAVLFGVLLSCIISLFFTSYFAQPTSQAQDLLTFVPQITDTYFILDLPSDVYDKAIIAYSSIYYNKTTSSGYYQHLASSSYLKALSRLGHAMDTSDCSTFLTYTTLLNTTQFLSYANCDFLASCGLNLTAQHKGYCLYTLNPYKQPF